MKAPLQPGKSLGSAASSAPAQRKGGLKTIVDNRPSAIAQRKLQGVVQAQNRMAPIQRTEAFLDDLLNFKSLSFSNLPSTLYIKGQLLSSLQEMEQTADSLNRQSHHTQEQHAIELGAMLGYSRAGGDIEALPALLGDGHGSFAPTNLDKLPLGFAYQGTVHTHPRRRDDDPLNSFSAIDFISVVAQTHRERISMMVSGEQYHLLTYCADSEEHDTIQSLTEQIVCQSLEEVTQDQEGEAEISIAELMEYAKGPATMSAIMQAARNSKVGYYVGDKNGVFMKF